MATQRTTTEAGLSEADVLVCTKCKRTRAAKYIALRKVYGGKKKYRCRARSVCSSIARRKNASEAK